MIVLLLQIDTVTVRKAARSKAFRLPFYLECRLFRKSLIHKKFGSATVSICSKRAITPTIAVAVIGPMPGTSAIFLHNADCFMNVWIEASMR